MRNCLLLIAALIFKNATSISLEASNETLFSMTKVKSKVETLLLQKNRKKALEVLYESLNKNKLKPSESQELRTLIEDISTLFISDRSQKSYESALSLKKIDPLQSYMKLQEILKNEPENALVVSEIAIYFLQKNECQKALDFLEKNREFNVYQENMALLHYGALLCLKKLFDIDKQNFSFFSRKNYLGSLWLSLDLQRAFYEKKRKQFDEFLENLKKVDSKHPDIFYWGWILETKSDKRKSYAKKYENICHTLSNGDLKKYSFDPFFCKREMLEVMNNKNLLKEELSE